MSQRSFIGWTLYVGSGLLLWAGHFLLAYVLAALACANGFATQKLAGVSLVTWILAAISVVAIVGCCKITFRALSAIRGGLARGETERFLHFLAGGVAVLALAGISGTALSGFLPLQCGA